MLNNPQKNPKSRKCSAQGCYNRFVPERLFIRWCSPECGAAIGKSKIEKQKEKLACADRKETKKKLDKLKTRSDYIKEAQTVFNAYIRARAIRFNHHCISSGAPLKKDGVGGGFDAGHYRSIGSAPHLRFNLNNVWGQTKQDNRYGAGASFEYRKGLISRRGIDVVEMLEADDRPRKFTIEY